jgi:hypothetical protein
MLNEVRSDLQEEKNSCRFCKQAEETSIFLHWHLFPKGVLIHRHHQYFVDLNMTSERNIDVSSMVFIHFTVAVVYFCCN